MQVIAHNISQLDSIVRNMYSKISEFGELQICYEKPFKDKTLKQLGYFFGGLCKAVREFYLENGIDSYSLENIKENFYYGCSAVDDRLLKTVRRFNGEMYQVPKRLSEMNREEASLFIDTSLRLIDMAKCFEGLVLHPSLRYTWVRHITPEDCRYFSDKDIQRIDKEYLSHIRSQACIWCGVSHQSEPHHLKLAGISGTGYKSPDCYAVPLCHKCHIAHLHQNGAEAFLRDLRWITKYITIKDFCLVNYNRWKNKGL